MYMLTITCVYSPNYERWLVTLLFPSVWHLYSIKYHPAGSYEYAIGYDNQNCVVESWEKEDRSREEWDGAPWECRISTPLRHTQTPFSEASEQGCDAPESCSDTSSPNSFPSWEEECRRDASHNYLYKQTTPVSTADSFIHYVVFVGVITRLFWGNEMPIVEENQVITPINPPLPPARVPVRNKDGSYSLVSYYRQKSTEIINQYPSSHSHFPHGLSTLQVFPSANQRTKQLKHCHSKVQEGCIAGLRSSCSITAAKQCQPSIIARLSSFLFNTPLPCLSDIDTCQDRAMTACIAQGTPQCSSHTQEFCAIAFHYKK